tara:strand:- start:425 stop:625 length:201 start_codon:yes stop_codon:yes gene_type:complete
MYVLVIIAYLAGEAAIVKASPDLYNTRDACVFAASRVMSDVYSSLPSKSKGKVSLVYMCNPTPKEA